MAAAVKIGSFVIATSSTDVSSTQKLVDIVGGVTAEQIRLIAFRIGDRIGNNLGIEPKARIADIVREKRGTPIIGIEKRWVQQEKARVALAIKNGTEKLLSLDNHKIFLKKFGWAIEEDIAESFSIPTNFLETGVSFMLSHFFAEGKLHSALRVMELEIAAREQVPEDYSIELKLDQALSKEKGELVFNLIQKSKGIEFQQESFTVAELEQNFWQ